MKNIIAVAPGGTYIIYVGAGSNSSTSSEDTWRLSTSTVIAKGGNVGYVSSRNSDGYTGSQPGGGGGNANCQRSSGDNHGGNVGHGRLINSPAEKQAAPCSTRNNHCVF